MALFSQELLNFNSCEKYTPAFFIHFSKLFSMQRRKFIYNSSMVVLSISVFGKIRWNGTSFVGTDPTTADILGPYYRPGAPIRTDLLQPGDKGDIIRFTGTIFGKDGKTPEKNALMEIWHCNKKGLYDNTSDDYIYRASWKTGADGKYDFRTIMPVPYKVTETYTRPAHIHMRISGTTDQDLVTQIYFKGDKYLPGDPSSADPKSINRILDVSTNAKNEKIVKFDVVLQDAYTLDAAGYKKIEGLYDMGKGNMVEFYHKGDDLFLKFNGQIEEAMEYKGNNSFEGGLGQFKVQFELLPGDIVRAKVSYLNNDFKFETAEGTRVMKY